MKKNLTLTVIALLIALTTFAQSLPIAISGKVTDEKNNEQPFSNVLLLQLDDSSIVKSSITDTAGNYTFEQVKGGNYLVAASMVGYHKTYSKPIHINKISPARVELETLTLSATSTNLNEVTIVGQTSYIEQQAGKTIINVENSILATDGTAMDVLAKSPGVTVDKDGNVSLKGKAGVNIMIDGKSTYLSSEELSTMLKNMPSNSIEKIELIANPSAKYEATGSAGIINIKTKRNKKSGLNGSANAGIAKGIGYRYNSGTNLGYRNKKYNLFGNYNFADNTRHSQLILTREINYNNSYSFFDQKHNSIERVGEHTYKGGIDYSINHKNTIGIMAGGFTEKGNENSTAFTAIKNNLNETDSSLSVINQTKSTYTNFTLNVNYKLAIDTAGKELTADADYAHYNTLTTNSILNNFYTKSGDLSGDVLRYKSNIPSIVDVKSLKIDYTHPIHTTMKLELGAKSSIVTTDNDVKFNVLRNEQWIVDVLRTNHFIYEENINAGYINFSKELKKTSLQFGLRGEQTQSKGNSITVQKVVDTNYFQLFPSLSVSQKITDNNQLTFSYSRRVNRPSYRSLNPFIYYIDPYSFAQGNPYLKPEVANKVEIAYTYKGAFTTAIGYSKTRDAAIQVTEQDDVTKVTKAIRKNLQTLNNVSIDISLPIPVMPWWMFINNINLYYNQYKSELSGGDLNTHSYSYSLYSNSTFTLPKNYSIEITGFYNSPGVYGIITYRPQYGVDGGIQKSFFRKQFVLKASMSDIFGTNRFIGLVNFQNMNIYIHEFFDSRIVKFSAVYKFGSNAIKSAKRKSGAEDELKRVNNK